MKPYNIPETIISSSDEQNPVKTRELTKSRNSGKTPAMRIKENEEFVRSYDEI